MTYAKYRKKFFMTESIGIFLGVPIALAYALFLIEYPAEQVNNLLLAAGVAGVLIVVFVGLPMNAWLTSRLKGLNCLDGAELNNENREILFERLSRIPFHQAIAVFTRIVVGSILIAQVYMRIAGIESSILTMTMVMGFYGAYTAGIVDYLVTFNITSPLVKQMVEKGLLKESFLDSRRYFGIPFTAKLVLYLVIPLVFTNVATLLAVQSSLSNGISQASFISKIAGLCFVNILTLSTSLLILRNMILSPNQQVEKALKALVSGDSNISAKISTDISDEFSRISYLMNRTMDIFLTILHEIDHSASSLNTLTMSLSSANQEISTSSNQQAAAVKEIVTTMEDSDKLSRTIARRVEEVAQIAEQTQKGVDSGFGLLKDNVSTMDAIRDRNADTLEGIRTLGEKIDNVWEIVKIINSIADQIKIIAFNAELEASSAGAAGKNFQIVASEIRRLADNTMKSTTQIKNRINEMQSSSDKLILASEEGTRKISEGWQLSNEIETIFKDIQSSSEISAASAKQIEVSIKQQVQAFEQILLTLRQIADGVQSFVVSTNDTSQASENMKIMTNTLSRILTQFFGRDGESHE